jgi:dinuclear metal center YbgI/SA1388 family protein
MTVYELYKQLCERIPPSLACEWDNDGIMCMPEPDRTIEKVLIALDITEAVVDRAVAESYDVIVSHHPLLFRGVKHLTVEDPVARRSIKLCRAGITALSFHTRLDALEGGVNDTLASVIGLKNVESFIGEGLPIGRVGELEAPMTLCDFAELVKAKLDAPYVLVSDAGREVRRVAVVGGDGKDFIGEVRALGADTYLSGRFDYHSMTDTPDAIGTPINLLEAGHFYTEFPVCATLCNMIAEISPEIECDIINGNRIKAI